MESAAIAPAVWLASGTTIGAVIAGLVLAGFHRRGERRLREAFAALSAEALDRNSERLAERARVSLDADRRDGARDMESRRAAIHHLVEPLSASLAELGGHLRALERERAGSDARVTSQVEALARAQETLLGETTRLSETLRSPQARGRWGELQLARIVELAGMREHCDFETQVHATGEHGALRPDLIVRLPGGGRLAVDAKVPLDAYLRAGEANSAEERSAWLAKHAQALQRHVRALASKGYWKAFAPGPALVVLFLPGEALFSAALDADPGLIERAAALNVVPASPTTLIALLRTVAHGWSQHRIAENASAITEAAGTLHARLDGFAQKLERLARGLTQSVDAYNAALGALEYRVQPAAKRLRDLGVGGAAPRQPRPVETAPRPPRSADA